jgi:predicted nuclease of predicted toxin-antitoxin system
MKFLFDQSADFRLIPHLRHLGHDVQVISRNYPPGLPDEDVLEIARKEQRILVSPIVISASLSSNKD